MKQFRVRSLLVQTVRMAAIVLIFGLIMYYAVTQILLNDLENSLIRFAEQGAITIDTYIQGHLAEGKSIAANSIISDTKLPLEQRLDELKKQLNLDRYRRLSIANTEGDSYTTDGATLYVGDRPYFINSMKGKTYVSDPFQSRADASMVIVFSVPIINDNKVDGVFYATYDADVLSHMTDNIKLNEIGSTYIINSKGDVIAHDDREMVYNKINDIIRAETDSTYEGIAHLEAKMLAGEKGTGEYFYYGERKYMGYCPIGETGWSLAVTSSKDEVFAKLNLAFIMLSILIFTATVVIAAVLSRSHSLKTNLIRQQVNTLRISDFMNLIAVTISDEGTIISANRYADELQIYFGKFGAGKVQNIYELLTEEDGSKLRKLLINFHEQKQTNSTSLELSLSHGASRIMHLYCNVVSDNENSDFVEILGIDITDRVKQEKKLQESFEELSRVYSELAATEEKIRQLAYSDSLTGLPNRAALYSEVEKVLAVRNKARKYALIYMDLDNFKYINDYFGHSIGDLLLKEVGGRLKASFSEDTLVARFEGDEFIIFMKDVHTNEEVHSNVAAAMSIFSEPFTIMKKHFHISVSCGIAVCPDHACTTEELLKCSDVAMYRAKKEGKDKYIVFEQEMNNDFTERINMEIGLRKAIKENEFILFYQPQVDLSTGKICGFEALIRWMSVEHGMIPPLEFIHIAEESTLIVPIGRWVLYTACSFIKDLNDDLQRRYTVSVNISVSQLMQADFVSMVMEALESTGLDPELLELELTESKLLETVEMNLQKLIELREKGIRISIDDFGKGFSSLSYLKQLPIDTLKIDKSFVDDIPESDKGMIESIILIGHRRNLIVVAEGVEKQEQIDFLTQYKCDRVQGFHYSKPVPENEVRKLLA